MRDKAKIINHALEFKFGGMSSGELSTVYDLCYDKNVLELGSMAGMSSYVIASTAKELSCVDIWSDNQDYLSHDPIQAKIYKNFYPELLNVFDKFQENCKEFIESEKIKIYKGLTQDLHDQFLDESFDVILIDADHSYIGISRDFNLYYRKLKPNGFIVFHDYGDTMWTGVKEFCDKMVEEKKLKFFLQEERIAVFKLV